MSSLLPRWPFLVSGLFDGSNMGGTFDQRYVFLDLFCPPPPLPTLVAFAPHAHVLIIFT